MCNFSVSPFITDGLASLGAHDICHIGHSLTMKVGYGVYFMSSKLDVTPFSLTLGKG